MHAIRDRKRKDETASDDKVNVENINVKDGKREYLKDVSVRCPEMREPKVHDSLSWRKRKGQVMPTKNAQVIYAAASSLNKFANDGSFLRQHVSHHNKEDGAPRNLETANMELNVGSSEAGKPGEETAVGKQEFSANQLAAKAMQLRMKGKHEEAEKLTVRCIFIFTYFFLRVFISFRVCFSQFSYGIVDKEMQLWKFC